MAWGRHIVIILSAVILAACGEAMPRNEVDRSLQKAPAEIRIVGSSTVFPFSTKVAQEFKNKTGYNVVVESTGSGGGHKLFCNGVGERSIDIINSSRPQKKSEFDMCRDNDVDEILEVKIGFDGIVIANAIDAPQLNMRLRDVFLAFAKHVPVSETNCELQLNPYKTWADVNPDLPPRKIEAFGPPLTSGSRDAFVEIAMELGAETFPCIAAMRLSDPEGFDRLTHTLREDGKWIDSGENDNVLVQTLINTPSAVGIFGYSFLDQNRDKIKAAQVDGIDAKFDNIISGDYPVSRSLYFYVKKANMASKPGLHEFALEFTSEEASGPEGYLRELGLVPLLDPQRKDVRASVMSLESYHP